MQTALVQSTQSTQGPLVPGLALHDYKPELHQFRQEVLNGLSKPEKELPCKYFYDERGSQLFERICELEEYYPTRTETRIMCQHAGAMAEALGRDCVLIEYGSGSSTKTRILLDTLRDRCLEPAAYMPLDISREHLLRSAASLVAEYPGLQVLPVCADYTADFTLPRLDASTGCTVVYFPGSTIGNFHLEQARDFLVHVAEVCGPGGGLLIGVDLEKDTRILEPAYNDSLGVTAEFNLNLLRRINRELDADFCLDQFHHHAFYNKTLSRIEMHLISLQAQTVHIGTVAIPFRAGESILTECSYKYTLEKFARLAASAGWKVEVVWTDDRQLFSVHYCSACNV